MEKTTKAFNLSEVMAFVGSDKPEAKTNLYREPLNYIPSRNIYIPVDKEKVLANGTVQPEDADQIVDRVEVQQP